MHPVPAALVLAALAALCCRCSSGGVDGHEPPVEVASTLPPAAADAKGADYPTPTAAPGGPMGFAPDLQLPDGGSAAPPPGQPFPAETGTAPGAPGAPPEPPLAVEPTPEGTTL
jgi:hypothetical protein